MRPEIIDRIIWSLYRRHKVARRVENFIASPVSYANGNSKFEGFNRLYDRAVVGDVSIGRFTYLAPDAKVVNGTVGRYCSIGPGALIGGMGLHPSNWISTHPIFFSTKGQLGGFTYSDRNYFDEQPATDIGNDVWIGARAIVLDGRKVGDGAIIAAGAVVVKDVAPYSIVGGVPARVIRFRFDEATISRLLEIKWWNWPIERARSLAHLFRSDVADTFVEACDMQRA
jgi:acetyltransferase-like isoleucine patch superfamily enzyme